MKYSIEGFNQRAVLSFKKEIVEGGKKTILKLDITDLVILRWFVDFFPKMKKYTEANVQYAWVHYDSLLEDIPLLQIGKIPLYRRLQKMVSLGILTHKHVKVNGSFSYYGFGENYSQLIDDKYFEESTNCEGSTPYDSKVTPPMTSKSYPYDFKIKPLELQSKSKDPSTKDSSTKKNNKKVSKQVNEKIEKSKEEIAITFKSDTPPEQEVKNQDAENLCLENQKTFDEIIDSYTGNEQLRSELKEHLRTRKIKKSSLTNRAIELSLKELDKLADTDEEKILIVQNSIMGGYSKFYKLKKDEASRLSESNFNIDEFEKYLADKYKQ